MDAQTDLEIEIIQRYADCPLHLDDALKTISETDLDLSEKPADWTIRQYIHHIVDGDDIWKTFIKRALGNPRGAFTLDWYWQIPQEDWAETWRYVHRAVEPSIDLFRANRSHIVQLLHQVPGALEKGLTVCMPDGKEQQVCVREVVEMQTRHVAGHIADIQRIIALHRAAPTANGEKD